MPLCHFVFVRKCGIRLNEGGKATLTYINHPVAVLHEALSFKREEKFYKRNNIPSYTVTSKM